MDSFLFQHVLFLYISISMPCVNMKAVQKKSRKKERTSMTMNMIKENSTQPTPNTNKFYTLRSRALWFFKNYPREEKRSSLCNRSKAFSKLENFMCILNKDYSRKSYRYSCILIKVCLGEKTLCRRKKDFMTVTCEPIRQGVLNNNFQFSIHVSLLRITQVTRIDKNVEEKMFLFRSSQVL